MENLSRRSLLTTTSVGLAAAGALAATRPLSAGAASLPSVPAVPHVADLDAPVVAHVEDLASGQVVLFAGEKAVTVTDHALAQLLAHHAR